MSDGPHKSLPMRHHWKNLAERAMTPAFTIDQVAEAFPVALKNDFCEVPLAQIQDIFGSSAQSSLFQENCEAKLEAMRHVCRGSVAGTMLIDCALEVHANGLSGDAAFRTALENAVNIYVRAACYQIEEHYRREEPRSTADIRDRLNAAWRQCGHSKIASELTSDDGGGGKMHLPKRTGLDEGPRL